MNYRFIDAYSTHLIFAICEKENQEFRYHFILDCLRKPSFSCFQKNVHNYLNSALELDDVNVTSSFKFLKNKVDLYKYTKEANDHFMKENEIPDEEARSGITIFIKFFLCVSSCLIFFFMYYGFDGLMVKHIHYDAHAYVKESYLYNINLIIFSRKK